MSGRKTWASSNSSIKLGLQSRYGAQRNYSQNISGINDPVPAQPSQRHNPPAKLQPQLCEVTIGHLDQGLHFGSWYVTVMRRCHYPEGLILWFTRNKLSGSYFCLIDASLSKFPPYVARTRPSPSSPIKKLMYAPPVEYGCNSSQ